MMNSKEALKRLFDSYVSSKFYGINYKEDDEDYNIIEQDLDRLKRLEKELKQTKLNFRNSQIHSKNCYKKLKEKYTRLERTYKNNEVMTRDLNELINRNLELKEELKKSQETINAWMENHKKLIIDNGKMKKAIKILKEKVEMPLLDDFEVINKDYIHLYRLRTKALINEEEYELLSEVFGNE